MPRRKDSEYKRGMRDEKRIIQALQEVRDDVRISTKTENILHDIDVWVGETPISIKSQPSAIGSGRVVFELQVKEVIQELGRACSQSSKDYIYRWTNSWFWNGKAETYLILIGEDLLVVDAARLKALINQRLQGTYNPDVYIKHGNHPDTVKRQMKAGHRHHDASIALVNVDYLIECGIAKWSSL